MTALSRIVVGVDGHSSGWEGLRLAQRFLRLGGGHLTVACAYPELGLQHAGLMWNGMATEPDARRVLREARTHLDAPEAAGFVAVCGAMPGACLQDVASQCDADLLVLGGSQTGTIGRVLGGSVLMAALVAPPCPVAVAPRGGETVLRGMTHVGVAVDGSPEAAAALRWAHELALEHDSIHELALIAAAGGAHADVPGHGRSELLAGGAGDVRHGRGALDVRWTQVSGPAARELAALTMRLDLLVIGTHGRGRLSRLLHGSVSGDVARSSRCPVVAVPFTSDA